MDMATITTTTTVVVVVVNNSHDDVRAAQKNESDERMPQRRTSWIEKYEYTIHVD